MPKRPPRTPRFDPADALLDGHVEDTLDLHGCYGSEVAAIVQGFVRSSSRKYSGKIVRIMTGKGRRSLNGPVLKPLVGRLLRTELRGLIADSALDLDEAGYLVRLK